MITKGTIALAGESGSGKTTQIGELAKAVKRETGLNTFLATNESGGYDSIEHLEDLGILTVEKWDGESDIFTWINHVASGERRINGAWQKLDKTQYGLWAFDSGSAWGEEGLKKLSSDAAAGKNIGGAPGFKVQLGDGSSIASNNLAQYGLVQTFVKQRISQAQRLPGLMLMTFTLKASDDATQGQMAGFEVAGGALANRLPALFRYTFRIKQEHIYNDKPKHILYMQGHTDGRLGGYANARVPLSSYADLNISIDPADLPKALDEVQAIKLAALEKDRAELGI